LNYELFLALVKMVLGLMNEITHEGEEITQENFEQKKQELKEKITLAGMLLLVLKEAI